MTSPGARGVNPQELEVVWPLGRDHYLTNVPDDDPDAAEVQRMTDTEPGPTLPTRPGRALAARALLMGSCCRQRRVGELLGVSPRTMDA